MQGLVVFVAYICKIGTCLRMIGWVYQIVLKISGLLLFFWISKVILGKHLYNFVNWNFSQLSLGYLRGDCTISITILSVGESEWERDIEDIWSFKVVYSQVTWFVSLLWCFIYIKYHNLSPGSSCGQIPVEESVCLIAESINIALEQTKHVTAGNC